MVKGVIHDGVIVPRDPLPEEWTEGTEVEVAKRGEAVRQGDLDDWFAELESLAAQGDPDDDCRLEQALAEIRKREKELARRRMGLP